VAVTGVDNLIVIASADAVMILPRGESQEVKKIVEALKAAKHPAMNR
jgi:mannose-1-phosphate guanylyltransferase/mannose-1-phosphate guanylyltransferase/mannose-6-phosphate isomerase